MTAATPPPCICSDPEDCVTTHVDDCPCQHPDSMHVRDDDCPDHFLRQMGDVPHTCSGCLEERPNQIRWCWRNAAGRWCAWSSGGLHSRQTKLTEAIP